ncbi:concanavalin A-like lectin/glucanase domain-containing protein [Ephemerocybe angulata]|uniref:Concanavalin A-like lectin/glucanase domain-containing protein n=1 Tax=Ephemerocybe angulata TaxID=980116 RepID=A0A8H6IF85_9AGAR|nr:concanavalin A-like lectin/glucanase domain-containing protein [Tulosesus angulatus]
MRSFYYLLQLLFAGLAAAQCNTYAVANVTGGFRTRQFVDFSTAQAGQSASTLLSNNGFSISDWPVTDTPPAISHTFVPGNVALTNGALSLKVNAYSGSGNVIGAEFSTNEEFTYVSVRTVQKSSSVPGVCEGNFFYKDQVAEIDFEILTSTIFQSSLACVPPGIWATTHPFKEGVESYSETFPFPFDPRADFHEYRVDWTPGIVRYYLDKNYVGQITQNVPTVSGSWIWNAWSNGDPCWSAGPPTQDSTTLIRSIEIYKDYTDTRTGTVCNV